MKRVQKLLGLALLILLLAGCSGATSSLGEINTPAGAFEISKVEVSDTFPPGCEKGTAICQEAKPGYQIVVVWLEPKGEIDATSGGIKVQDEVTKADITAADGNQTKGAGGGMWMGEWFVMFTPPDSAKDFTLNWPGNPPIELGK